MIRSRLLIAFALVAGLALAQSLFAWWAAASAAHHAERSVAATRLLAEYLELSGNKQRLKVWFAQRMLTGDEDPQVRERLEAAMLASVVELRRLAQAPGAPTGEAADIELLARNVTVLKAALATSGRPQAGLAPDQQWRTVMRAFDELAGRDMRELLRSAVARVEAASQQESAALAAALARVHLANLLLALLVVLVAGVSVAYFVRRLDRPVARLARLSEALAAGDFSARSGLSGVDEFARIGRLLDSMAARLAEAQARSHTLQERLGALVSERTRAVSQAYESVLALEAGRRQFFAELSHELRTPVTVIRGEADLALRARSAWPESAEALRRITTAAAELGGRVQDLLDAARSGRVGYAFTLAPLALPAMVRPAVEQMQVLAQFRGVGLDFAEPAQSATPWVEADRERLRQALVVLLDNALRHSPPGRRVQVSIAAEGEHWAVQVDDEGPGMSDAAIERAFDPPAGRMPARPDDDGLGVGLLIAQRILQAHRGSVDLLRRPSGGLRASLVLPALTVDGPLPERGEQL